MPEYTIKWPLELNAKNSGFTALNEFNLIEVAKFNLRNILLTVPGERIMVPSFGVGIRTYLFEQSGQVDNGQLQGRIIDQVNTWAPYINIQNIDISFSEKQMSIRIEFNVPSAELSDVLNLDVNL
jgi:phage baseplate assembly protein W